MHHLKCAARYIPLLATVLFVLHLPALAQSNAQRPPIKVQLSVSADDGINGEIVSYISRELRQFKDVQITDDSPDWRINIVAMEATSKSSNYKLGVVLSIIITEPYHNIALNGLAKDVRSQKLLNLLTDNLESPRAHWLRVGSNENLQRMCTQLVADFDGEHLEETRKILDRVYQRLSGGGAGSLRQ